MPTKTSNIVIILVAILIDDPEIYIRANKGKDPVKILKSVVKEASKDFFSFSMTVR